MKLCPMCNKAYPYGDTRANIPDHMCLFCEQEFLSKSHIKQLLAVIRRAREAGGTFFVKFTCLHCGSRQTIETPNTLHSSGRCEECNKISDFKSPAAKLGLLFQSGTPLDVINSVIGE